MRLLFAVTLAVIAVCNVEAVCPDINGCSSCVNYGVLCDHCPTLTTFNQDSTACLDCSDGCGECETDSDDLLTCVTCLSRYYLTDGACSECTDGCEECHEDSEGTVICDACYESGYVQDTSSASGACIACDSNCKSCSLDADLTTTCAQCNSDSGSIIRGYFLKTSDKSCSRCPTNCATCSDNGEGAGLCTNCFINYLPLVDEDDSTNDATKCVACPSECSACTGVEFTTGVATCTGCVDGNGNFNSEGECISCDDNCFTCTDTGECETCDTGYRLDSGSCTICPAFCDSCSVDDSSGDDVCAECDTGYGTKVYDTCDVCTAVNCDTCTRASDGTMTCGTCIDGYGPKADGVCTACSTGCMTCSYSSDHMKCLTCKTGYTDAVYPAASSSSAADPSICLECPSTCATCTNDGADAVDCLTCTNTATHYFDDSQTPTACSAMPANCASAASGACVSCSDGYFNNSGSCDACTSALQCAKCSDASACDTCELAFTLVDTDADSTTDTCEACGISNCEVCDDHSGTAGDTKKCSQCEAGYTIYDADTESTVAGSACKKCPTGCDSCSVDYTDNGDATICSSGGCDIWDGSKAYTDGETGTCERCSSDCEACTYVSTTASTSCDDAACSSSFQKNSEGVCETCPGFCNACELTTDGIVCTDGQCDTGYGNDAEGGCSECPTRCDECSMSGETDDAVLHCATCESGSVRNDDVCGDCPSNCIECADDEGSMVCSNCDEAYYLDSSKSCVKCATNCAECTASKCTSCISGYGVSADGLSCVACGVAAYENCKLCGNMVGDSNAECWECNDGYALEDKSNNKTCVDASSLICGSGTYSDNPSQCSVCEDGFELTDDLLCAKMCYACGDVEKGDHVDPSSCVIPTGGANATSSANEAQLIPCISGVCYGAHTNGKVMGGCRPSSITACSADANAGETCMSTSDVEWCERCCSASECNTWIPELDGITDSATSAAINMMLISLAAAAGVINFL